GEPLPLLPDALGLVEPALRERARAAARVDGVARSIERSPPVGLELGGVHVAVPTVVRHERCTRSNGDRTPASPRRDEVRNEKGAPSGIRTRATALKGPRPGPLVDGGGRARIAPTPRARPSRRADLTRGRRPGQLAALAPSSTRAADADPRAPRG